MSFWHNLKTKLNDNKSTEPKSKLPSHLQNPPPLPTKEVAPLHMTHSLNPGKGLYYLNENGEPQRSTINDNPESHKEYNPEITR